MLNFKNKEVIWICIFRGMVKLNMDPFLKKNKTKKQTNKHKNPSSFELILQCFSLKSTKKLQVTDKLLLFLKLVNKMHDKLLVYVFLSSRCFGYSLRFERKFFGFFEVKRTKKCICLFFESTYIAIIFIFWILSWQNFPFVFQCILKDDSNRDSKGNHSNLMS